MTSPVAGASTVRPPLAMVLAAISLVLVGCIADRTDPRNPSSPVSRPPASPPPSSGPVASAVISSAPEPTVELTPPPTVPANLGLIATEERDGVRVTIELERNPMPAGQPTWVTTAIKNTADDPVIYYPCGEAATVGATIADLPWRPGASLPNPAMAWKDYLTGGQGLEGGRRVLFFPAGQDGAASGCGDIGHVATITPGATFRERARWDGLTFRRLNPPPTASIDLVGSFSFDRGDPRVEHLPEDRNLIEVHLDMWIAGLPDAFLDPAEAADIALTDARLTAVLASHDLRNGNEGVLLFDPKTGVYQIGLLESGNLPVSRVHLLLVDARTGEIVGFIERDWDYQVDGYP
jgi:hypothetical protein